MLQTFEIGRLPADSGFRVGSKDCCLSRWSRRRAPILLPAPTTRRGLRRAQRPRALSDKGLSLYNLDRKDEALNLYDKIARRKAKGPAQRGVAAKALFNKGYLLYELDRTDGASASATKLSPLRHSERA